MKKLILMGIERIPKRSWMGGPFRCHAEDWLAVRRTRNGSQTSGVLLSENAIYRRDSTPPKKEEEQPE